MKYSTLLIFLFLLSGTLLHAQSYELSSGRKAVKTSGDVLFIAAPVAALTTVLLKEDWQGLKQGAFTAAATAGVSYALKYSIKKERPDGSNNHSFPSFHTGVTFATATFLQRRYGWQYGIPAYAVASYVGWSRSYGKKHDWWDIVAGAAIGAGSAFIFTRPFAGKHQLAISPVATDSHMGFHTSFVF